MTSSLFTYELIASITVVIESHSAKEGLEEISEAGLTPDVSNLQLIFPNKIEEAAEPVLETTQVLAELLREDETVLEEWAITLTLTGNLRAQSYIGGDVVHAPTGLWRGKLDNVNREAISNNTSITRIFVGEDIAEKINFDGDYTKRYIAKRDGSVNDVAPEGHIRRGLGPR